MAIENKIWQKISNCEYFGTEMVCRFEHCGWMAPVLVLPDWFKIGSHLKATSSTWP